jgi:hypothetical protein
MKTMFKTKSAFGTLLPLPVTALAAGGIAALACATSHAAVMSLEPFSGYTVGTELPNNTPSPVVAGYTGDWTGVDWGNVKAGTLASSLSYGGAGYAAGIGDHIGVASFAGGITWETSGRTYRLLDSSLTVNSANTGTRYLSFLFQSGQEYGATVYQMLDLYNTDTADANRTFTAGLTQNGGQSGNIYDFGVNEAYSNTGVSADAGVHLFVVGFDLSATAGSDSVTVWLDPTLGAGVPAGGVTVAGQNIAFDRLAISDYSGNSANWDEIRWGTTFDSVTVPEPSAGALLLGGVGVMAAFLRRRTNQA